MLDAEMVKAMVVWPGLASGAVLVPLAVPAVRSRVAVTRALIAASALVGLAVAFEGILGTSALEISMDAKTRVLPMAAIGMALGVLPRTLPRWIRLSAAVLAGAVGIRIILASATQSLWSAGESLMIVGASALALGGLALSVDRVLGEVSPKMGAIGLVVIAGMPAPLMLFADSLALAQLHTSIAVVTALAAAAVLLGVAKSLQSLRYAVVFASFALWLLALIFANVGSWAFALLVTGLPAAALAMHVSRGTRRSLVALGGFALPVVCALVLGFLRYQEDVATVPDDDVSYGYPS